MAKFKPKTRVLLDGVDISGRVSQCSLPRFPDRVETVELVMEVDRLEVEADGTLVIRIRTRDDH